MALAKELRSKGVQIELNGEIKTIKYDLNAFAELENIYGSVEAAMEGLEKGNISQIRSILWAGLIHSEANIDAVTGDVVNYKLAPFTVGSWITLGQLAEVTKAIGLALEQDMPEDIRKKMELDMPSNDEEQKNEGPQIAVIVGGVDTKNV